MLDINDASIEGVGKNGNCKIVNGFYWKVGKSSFFEYTFNKTLVLKDIAKIKALKRSLPAIIFLKLCLLTYFKEIIFLNRKVYIYFYNQ